MSHLNLGILAHVDAGKTSLTERLLYDAGAIDEPGSVDAGTTRTDSMDLERRRGITIRAAVTSFDLGDLTVNVLDTPGHPDFIAEVERSLAVLDAAVLVLSSVEGVQPQSVVLWRALRRLGVPTVLFVNKVDRAGADVDAVVGQVRRRLTPAVVPLTRVSGEGTRAVSVGGIPLDDDRVLAVLGEVDDWALARLVANKPVDAIEVRRRLRRAVRTGGVTPLLAGSAITGAGTEQLRRCLVEVMPRTRSAGSLTDQMAASVFKIDHDGRGKQTYLRIWSGGLATRDRLRLVGRPAEPVTEVRVSRPGGLVVTGRAAVGEIAVVRGLSAARIGDTVGLVPARVSHQFPPATMSAVVEPLDPTRRTALFAALTELAEQDPLIAVRVDQTEGEVVVSLHGEVQQQVIGALLEERYAVPARFLETSIVCIERVVGVGAAVDRIKVDGNPYLAGLGLRVESGDLGSGVVFSPGVERGNLPSAFISATEEGVRAALEQGRCGWRVTDCRVTMTESAYFPRQSAMHQKFNKAISSVAADFRHLAPVVVMGALERAGTSVCEPVERFDLEVPQELFNSVVAALGPLGGIVHDSRATGEYVTVTGFIPSARVPVLVGRLPDLTGGEGVLTSSLDHYTPVLSSPPARRRRGVDPLDRDTWFRDVPR